MQVPKKYLHDKLILALVSSTVFLALACIVIILLRYGSNNSSSYIVQYRQNLGISSLKLGSVVSILSFTLFAPLISVINILLSLKVYEIRRQLSVVILAMGVLVIVLAIIVSNALLNI